MNREKIAFQPIGMIRSQHAAAEKTPIQPVFARGCRGRAEIFPAYAAGLRDLEGFSHVYLLYAFHKAGPPKMTVKPFLQDDEHGVFATRATCRPNPIGMSIVRLVRREGNVLHLDGLDILDGTPLLDIKPYVGRFDRIETRRNGWQDSVDEETAQRRGKRGYAKKATTMCETTTKCGCTDSRKVDPKKCSKDQIKKCHGDAKK